MIISKQDLRKLIKEEYIRAIKEQMPQSGTIDTANKSQPSQQKADPKQVLKQNASKQIRLLKFMKETLKQMKVPQEVATIIDHIKKSGTPEFLEQVLNVEKSIPVNVAAAITNPIGLLQSILDEILNSSIRHANQKLAEGKEEFNVILEEKIENIEQIEEGEFHVGHDEQERLEKHKKKEIKKHHKKDEDLPPVHLSPEDMEKFKELSKKK